TYPSQVSREIGCSIVILSDTRRLLPRPSEMATFAKTRRQRNWSVSTGSPQTRSHLRSDPANTGVTPHLHLRHRITFLGMEKARARAQRYESPRVCRRLQPLRDWGHETGKEVLPRGAGAGGSDGVRARE